MSTGLFLYLIGTALLFICYYLVIVCNREEEKMNTMMTTMAGGMAAGVLYGTLLGILFRGNFIEATILSIVIGMTIGAFLGLPAQLLACIEGMLAGLMGGMMGAMVGVMSPVGQEDTILKFLYMISLVMLLCTIRLFYSQTKSRVLQFLQNPIIALLVVLFAFLVLEKGSPIFPVDQMKPHLDHHEVLNMTLFDKK
ncbi:hypothetical protein [Halalkalibacter krulwichiae]|uniref:Uncharacterized protein n=1 Tax=Halalkalibacter krulwichiae TaxID=199441 RepID=A0A1X9MB93_9BACI|nr:hypothetical protein [Halalkalibacter krulwichiae]ARK30715.1 hypothetical protein BkAM31D_13240 [Halalkalibacter krulwichiae]